jgi:hypothetical protein
MADKIRLLRRSKPKADESFIGYIIRLTAENGYERLSWILKKAEIYNGIASNPAGYTFVFKKSINLTKLSQMTNVSIDALESMMYRPINIRGSYTSRHLFITTPVSRYFIQVKKPKVCPCCLQESAYYRKIWDLAPITACPIHQCLLMDRCPKCHARIKWGRANVCICKCKFDWRNSYRIPVDSSDFKFNYLVHHLCGIKVNVSLKPSRRKNPLFKLDLENLLSSLFFIVHQYRGIPEIEGKYSEASLENRELHTLLVRAFTVFEDWPTRFYELLDWLRTDDGKSGSIRNGSNFALLPFTLYGKHQRYLSNQLDFF